MEKIFGAARRPDPARCQPAAEFDGVVVLRNLRALPRAWLVSEVESVDGEEALRRVRGYGGCAFDLLRTALLEVTPHELPALPGGAGDGETTAGGPNGSARVRRPPRA